MEKSTKHELCSRIAKKMRITHAEATKFVDVLPEVVSDILKEGKNFDYHMFMKIEQRTQAKRTMRNVITGKLYEVPEKNTFKAVLSNFFKNSLQN